MYVQIGSEHVFQVFYECKEPLRTLVLIPVSQGSEALLSMRIHPNFVLVTSCSEMPADEFTFLSICPLLKTCFSHKINPCMLAGRDHVCPCSNCVTPEIILGYPRFTKYQKLWKRLFHYRIKYTNT